MYNVKSYEKVRIEQNDFEVENLALIIVWKFFNTNRKGINPEFTNMRNKERK